MSDRAAWISAGFVTAVLLGAPVVALALKLVTSATDRDAIKAFRDQGLRYGGLVIGALERCLVFTFVLRGEFQAIGLILAAKGLIRYAEIKDARDQKVAEYVLIGTMLSLLWAVGVALLVERGAPAG